MKKKVIIGVMGPAQASDIVRKDSYVLGKLIAEEGWILLSGGEQKGVMTAVCEGAKAGGGQTVGILRGETTELMSPYVDIPILTGLGSARNNINVLTSNIVIACGVGKGTASEVCLALACGKSVILLHGTPESNAFFNSLASENIHIVDNPVDAIALARKLLV